LISSLQQIAQHVPASAALSEPSNYGHPGDAANMLQVEFFNRADLPASEEIPCAEPGEEANMLQVGAYAVHGEQAEQKADQPFAQNQPPGNQPPPMQQQPLVQHPPTPPIAEASEMDLNELIAVNGVFRGMRVSKDLDATRLNTVVEFGSSLPSASQMLLNPDDAASEIEFKSDDERYISKSKQVVSTYGYKSAYSSSHTRTHSYVRPPRWWWWHGHNSQSSSEWSYDSNYERDWSYERDTDTERTTKTYTKVKYFVEPTAELVIDTNVLQPVSSFLNAVSKLPEEKGDAANKALDDFFESYGTHVCTHVMFGGWWRIESNVKSKTAVSTSELDYAVNYEIDRTWQHSYDYGWRWNSWWWGGHSYQSQGESEHQWSVDRDYSRSSATTRSGETVVSDTKQDWKGGESGGGAQQWRDSLRVGKKNWKVIERYPDDCLPVWTWVEGAKKELMCDRWRDTLASEMGFNDFEFAHLCSDGSLESVLGVLEGAEANKCQKIDNTGVAGVTHNNRVRVTIAHSDDECSQKCTDDNRCVALKLNFGVLYKAHTIAWQSSFCSRT